VTHAAPTKYYSAAAAGAADAEALPLLGYREAV